MTALRLPDRHSLLWKLIAAMALLCLLAVSLHVDLSRRVNDASARLKKPARQTLLNYASAAEDRLRDQGPTGLDAYLADLRARENVWAVAVDSRNMSLSSTPMTESDRGKLGFIRKLDGSVGRPGGSPTYYIPFADGNGRLVIELPRRLHPRQHERLWEVLLQKVLPASLAILLGILLYHVFIAPIVKLRKQAHALGAGDLSARVDASVCARRDELGDLGRTLNHMAQRLENTVVFQRQLLRALSHELRTPLSRLKVSAERELDLEGMRDRQIREVHVMERLIDDTLELVWLDTEQPRLPVETVNIDELWEMLRDDACFETGWDTERLLCDAPPGCQVRGNLNGLAQVFENILRNAIRHSPPSGIVRLGAGQEEDFWHLWVTDQGPGVADEKLESIFQPFTRLSADRPGGEGFGLGLSIARSVVNLQGGQIWAENAAPGLCVHLRLPSV